MLSAGMTPSVTGKMPLGSKPSANGAAAPGPLAGGVSVTGPSASAFKGAKAGKGGAAQMLSWTQLVLDEDTAAAAAQLGGAGLGPLYDDLLSLFSSPVSGVPIPGMCTPRFLQLHIRLCFCAGVRSSHGIMPPASFAKGLPHPDSKVQGCWPLLTPPARAHAACSCLELQMQRRPGIMRPSQVPCTGASWRPTAPCSASGPWPCACACSATPWLAGYLARRLATGWLRAAGGW